MHKSTWVPAGFACLAWMAIAAPARAANVAPTDAASAPLQVEWNARWRYADIDAATFAAHARANTLRLRLGLKAAFGHGFGGLIEGAGVASAGDHYNSGANGNTAYPVEADPHGALLNQAWVSWQDHDFNAILGRQRLQFDNQRWIGNSGWRQFEQTFDALALTWHAAPSIALRYAWLDRVHRVSGPDALNRLARARALNTHLFNAAWTRDSNVVTAYAYLHEDRDVPTASTATVGARWTGHLRPDGQGLGWAA